MPLTDPIDALMPTAFVRWNERDPITLDLMNNREASQLIRKALDKLWQVRDRALQHGDAQTGHCRDLQTNMELIEAGGVLYVKLLDLIDDLEDVEAAIVCAHGQ